MSKRKRILLIIIGIVLIALLILSFYANSIIKNKIEALLKEKMPEHIELLYKDIAVQSLTGTISIEEPNLLIKVKDSKRNVKYFGLSARFFIFTQKNLTT